MGCCASSNATVQAYEADANTPVPLPDGRRSPELPDAAPLPPHQASALVARAELTREGMSYGAAEGGYDPSLPDAALPLSLERKAAMARAAEERAEEEDTLMELPGAASLLTPPRNARRSPVPKPGHTRVLTQVLSPASHIERLIVPGSPGRPSAEAAAGVVKPGEKERAETLLVPPNPRSPQEESLSPASDNLLPPSAMATSLQLQRINALDLPRQKPSLAPLPSSSADSSSSLPGHLSLPLPPISKSSSLPEMMLRPSSALDGTGPVVPSHTFPLIPRHGHVSLGGPSDDSSASSSPLHAALHLSSGDGDGDDEGSQSRRDSLVRTIGRRRRSGARAQNAAGSGQGGGRRTSPPMRPVPMPGNGLASRLLDSLAEHVSGGGDLVSFADKRATRGGLLGGHALFPTAYSGRVSSHATVATTAYDNNAQARDALSRAAHELTAASQEAEAAAASRGRRRKHPSALYDPQPSSTPVKPRRLGLSPATSQQGHLSVTPEPESVSLHPAASRLKKRFERMPSSRALLSRHFRNSPRPGPGPAGATPTPSPAHARMRGGRGREREAVPLTVLSAPSPPPYTPTRSDRPPSGTPLLRGRSETTEDAWALGTQELMEREIPLEGPVAWGRAVSLNPRYENVDLIDESIVFGCNADADVKFSRTDQPAISGRHCRIWREEEISNADIPAGGAELVLPRHVKRVYIEDTSTNGTFVNGKKLGRGGKLQLSTGMEITLIPRGRTRQHVTYVLYLHDEADQHENEELLPAPEGHVTFVFTDIQGSTSLWEAAPVEMNESLEVHDTLMRLVLARFRGYEVKTEGDAFMCAFWTPIEAIRYCITVQQALLSHDWPDAIVACPSASRVVDESGNVIFNGLRVRMGIHTGQVNARRNPVTNRMDYFGQVVNLASRVAHIGHGGQVLCTQEILDAGERADREEEEKMLAEMGSNASANASRRPTTEGAAIAIPAALAVNTGAPSSGASSAAHTPTSFSGEEEKRLPPRHPPRYSHSSPRGKGERRPVPAPAPAPAVDTCEDSDASPGELRETIAPLPHPGGAPVRKKRLASSSGSLDADAGGGRRFSVVLTAPPQEEAKLAGGRSSSNDSAAIATLASGPASSSPLSASSPGLSGAGACPTSSAQSPSTILRTMQDAAKHGTLSLPRQGSFGGGGPGNGSGGASGNGLSINPDLANATHVNATGTKRLTASMQMTPLVAEKGGRVVTRNLSGSGSGSIGFTAMRNTQLRFADLCVAPLGAVPLKGIAEPVPVFQISTRELATRTFPPLRTVPPDP